MHVLQDANMCEACIYRWYMSTMGTNGWTNRKHISRSRVICILFMSDGKNWRHWWKWQCCQCWWWWEIIGTKLSKDIPVRETEHKTRLTFGAWIFLLKSTMSSSSSSPASTSPPFNVVCSLGGWTDTKEDGCLSRKPFIPQFSHFSFTPAFNNKIDLFKKSVWCQKTKNKCVFFGVRNPVLV